MYVPEGTFVFWNIKRARGLSIVSRYETHPQYIANNIVVGSVATVVEVAYYGIKGHRT